MRMAARQVQITILWLLLALGAAMLLIMKLERLSTSEDTVLDSSWMDWRFEFPFFLPRFPRLSGSDCSDDSKPGVVSASYE